MISKTKVRTPWSHEEDEVCVQAFFQYIDFNTPASYVIKEISEFIEKNVKDFNKRPKGSWLNKIQNIQYHFRKFANLPLMGLENASKICVDLTKRYFENSKFSKPNAKFGEEWFFVKTKASKTKTLSFLVPKEIKNSHSDEKILFKIWMNFK